MVLVVYGFDTVLVGWTLGPTVRAMIDRSRRMEQKTVPTSWWGKFSIALDTLTYWRVGPMEIWIARTAKEWRIGTRGHNELTDPSLVVNCVENVPSPTSADDVDWRRFGFRKTTETVELSPLLASRPLVVRPETTFVLPQKEEATLYISLPLWIQFELGQPASNVLEAVVFRPSDTWFGPSTMEGELCYASRTRARLRLEELDFVPHRALSAFFIRNHTKSKLKLDRLKLPMPNLSVYAAADGRLWTEMVTLSRREDGDLAELQLGKGPPPEVGPAELLHGPRVKPEKGLLIRAFGGLFG
jgi:hypothetical protein